MFSCCSSRTSGLPAFEGEHSFGSESEDEEEGPHHHEENQKVEEHDDGIAMYDYSEE